MTTLLQAPVRPAVIEVVDKPQKKVITSVPKSTGVRTEQSFQALLESRDNLWFSVVQEYPDMVYMLELAAQYHAAKLNTLLAACGGSFSSLEELGPKAFMDMLFKVDFLVEYKDEFGAIQRVAIDVTCNSREVKGKEIEITRKQATLAKLGVHRTCVVLWNITSGKPVFIKEPLLQTIRDRLVSNKYFCNTVILF